MISRQENDRKPLAEHEPQRVGLAPEGNGARADAAEAAVEDGEIEPAREPRQHALDAAEVDRLAAVARNGLPELAS